jgi:hypothetical protein
MGNEDVDWIHVTIFERGEFNRVSYKQVFLVASYKLCNEYYVSKSWFSSRYYDFCWKFH